MARCRESLERVAQLAIRHLGEGPRTARHEERAQRDDDRDDRSEGRIRRRLPGEQAERAATLATAHSSTSCSVSVRAARPVVVPAMVITAVTARASATRAPPPMTTSKRGIVGMLE